jgi:flagellar hook-associated protein 3 FlgL
MRITQSAVHRGVQANLQISLGRLSKLQEQLSSGRAISRPSDSPTSTVAALRFRADIRRSEQLKRNADDAVGWLDATDRALSTQTTITLRARDLLLQGINGSSGPAEREALAQEIDRLRESSIAAANATYLGRPIFGGTTTNPNAYDATTGAYVGDTNAIERSIAANVTVQANVTGVDAFGPPGADLFQLLDDIADHLRSGASASLSADLTALDTARQRLTNNLATVGARTNQLESVRSRVDEGMLDAQSALANVESIDLPATVMQLQLQEVAYQAALSATSRVIQPSLVDFLR